MLNKVIITGRLVDAPELRYTPSNKAVATARIACPRDFKNQNGERESDFFPLVFGVNMRRVSQTGSRKDIL